MAYFEHRSPAFWIPQRKPGPRHRIQFNPNAPFSQGLLSLLLFDGGTTGSAIEDKVSPHRVFSYTGTTQTFTSARRGGMAFSTGGNSTDQINYGTALSSSSNWTASALCAFDGAPGNTYAGNLVLVGSSGLGAYFGVFNTDGTFTSSAGGWTGATATPSLTGQHRITVTSSGSSTMALYIDGLQSGSSFSNQINFGPQALCSGWPWPVSDFFFWGRTLTASEISDHAANPYTVLRPRGDIRLARRPPGLPPQKIQIWDH